MNSALLTPLLITTFVAIMGWIIAHQFAVWRDRNNKRRDLWVGYLIDAYRKLEMASCRELENEEYQAIESALADIQLFGTASQVKKAQNFITTFSRNSTVSADDLLNDIRNDLRRELRLGKAESQLKFLRIERWQFP